MKSLIKLSTVIVLSAAFAGTAAASVSKNELTDLVRASIDDDSQIEVVENDGVVTLTGQYGSYLDQAIAIKAAESIDGVIRVINLANTNN